MKNKRQTWTVGAPKCTTPSTDGFISLVFDDFNVHNVFNICDIEAWKGIDSVSALNHN